MLKEIIISARYKQWTKNIFIFAGIVFSKRLLEPATLLKTIEAFVLFCTTSSGIYILNDIIDRKFDQLHPVKRFRPIASGKLPIPTAITTSLTLILGSIILALVASRPFSVVLISYVALQIIYSLYLKKMVIIDILSVALGFVLRVVAGCVIIDVQISSWLLLCTALLSLFIVLTKRRQELKLDNQNQSRRVLKDYSINYIDQMITLLSSATITTYLLYAFSPETYAKFGTHKIELSVPFVLYGIFRYLYLVYHKSLGEEPEKIVLTDKPFIVNFLLWVISILFAIYVR